MKAILSINTAFAVLALAKLPALATTYPGTGTANGGLGDGAGISSVVINNDANDITFTINTSQAMDQWMLYAVDIQIIGQAGSGYTTLANPLWLNLFGPAVGISSGENAVLDFAFDGYNTPPTWTGNNAAIPYIYSGGSWSEGSMVSYDAGGQGNTYVTATVPLSSLGLSVGDSFYFDVVSTYPQWENGGPQSAYGALDSGSGYPAETDSSWHPWNGSSAYDSATDVSGTTFGTAASEYTVEAVPEPTTLALLSGGLVLLMARRRRAR